MVTRTVKSTVAVIACLNRKTMEAEQVTIEIPFKVTDEAKILKYAKKHMNADIYIPASVIEYDIQDCVLGITLETFMENAVKVER